MGVQVPLSAPNILKQLMENGLRLNRGLFSFWTLFWTLCLPGTLWTPLDLIGPARAYRGPTLSVGPHDLSERPVGPEWPELFAATRLGTSNWFL